MMNKRNVPNDPQINKQGINMGVRWNQFEDSELEDNVLARSPAF